MFARIRIFTHINTLLVFLLLVAAAPSVGADVHDLEIDPDHVPYQVDLIKRVNVLADGSQRVAYVMSRIDGDGLEEWIEGHGTKIFGYDGEDGLIKPRWQMNLDPNFRLHQRSRLLGAVADFNGDSMDEIYTTITSLDRQQWRFLGFDPATESFTVNTPLPLGVDRRPDGIWDGYYVAVGAVKDADGQGQPGVVLLRNVEYDANPRGVCVVNPVSGQLIWEWECGPNPDIESPVVSDLDGDGHNEIVIFGHSPDNLGGVKVNGTSDNESLLFVLDSRGRLLWQGELGPTFTAGSLRMADLDGDGIQEIITFTYSVAVNNTNKLIIWAGLSGEMICQVRSPSGYLGAAFAGGPEPGTSWVFAGSSDGTIDRFLFDGTSLARDLRVLRAEPNCRVVGALDILPEPGPEILVDIGEGEIFAVLDRDLTPLAAHLEEGSGAKRNPSVWRQDGRTTSLVLGNQQANWILGFHPTPTNYAAMVRMAGIVLLGMAAAAAVFLLGLWRGRRQAAAGVVSSQGPRTADREVLYRLWRQLDDIKHEKMLEASRGLRRLVWLLEAYATGMGATDDLTERIGQLMRDFSEVVKPRLEGILQLARSERFENEKVATTTAALNALSERLVGLTTPDMNVTKVSDGRDEMKKELEEVETGLFNLWKSLRDYFSTDPLRMLKGMMLVREGEFSRADIEAEIVGPGDIPDSLCLIDSGDLRYVLANLIDNATRAMEDSEHRILRLQVKRSNSEISVHVSDTGPGIAPEFQGRIFSGRFSTRHGGGSGLFRSQEILKRWGGEIHLADSTPDKGTTFIVRLRAVRKPENALAQEAEA